MDTPLKIFGHNLTFKQTVVVNREVHRSEHLNSVLLMTLKGKQGTKLNPTLMFKSCADGKINSLFIHYKHNWMKNIPVTTASQVKDAHLYKNVEGEELCRQN
jgi:hypothetical protein